MGLKFTFDSTLMCLKQRNSSSQKDFTIIQ